MSQSMISRRAFVAGSSIVPVVGLAAYPSSIGVAQTSIEHLVIDLPSAPESIDPALAYSPRDWSIVHSIYDAVVQFDENGQLVPLAAESFTTDDAVTFKVKLRAGLLFHDGTPVTTEAIERSVAYMKDSGSDATDLFTVIEQVEIVDELNATIICAAPSPWLPAQLAAWIVLVPEGMTPDIAATAPIGSGPYRFESYAAGNEIVLVRNDAYTWGSPKGTPIANRVTYRFVPEASTRVADIASGNVSLITEVPLDQHDAVDTGGSTVLSDPIVGIGFVRIASDTAPFDDVRVRQALNYAVDVQGIAAALIGVGSNRLATLFPDERSLGFDPDLEPYAYDPDKAKSLLTEAGFPDGFSTELEMTATARLDIVEAIVEQLAGVGIDVEIVTSDYATFNAGWTDTARPPLRIVTWSPLYEPHTLLSLAFVSGGYLSRYGNPDADAVFVAASIEPDAERRGLLLRQFGSILHDDPAAIYLWNSLATYGVTEELASWAPRGDEYVIATVFEGA